MDDEQKVSIVLPVANEQKLIADTLNHLLSLGADEVIAVDGGSKDGTCEVIQRDFPSVRYFETAYADRALQMNLGAFEAKSDIFLFVHVDMRLPEDAVVGVREKIRQGFIGGGFVKRYEPANWMLNAYSFLQNTFLMKMMKCLVGSNAIFVSRSVFDAMHGYPEVSFLEDLIFSDCLSRKGRIAVINEAVRVSSRRYLETGILKQIFLNLRILLGHRWLHESPERLQERYRAISDGL